MIGGLRDVRCISIICHVILFAIYIKDLSSMDDYSTPLDEARTKELVKKIIKGRIGGWTQVNLAQFIGNHTWLMAFAHTS